jgi:oligopeptide transport system permease protein
LGPNYRPKPWPDFGPSYKLEDYTVNEVIAQGFPVSASLGIFALMFALALGLTAGVISAIERHSFYDVAVMALATLGIAVPNFVLASLAIIVFVFLLGWFPAAGWGSVQQLVLPALCLGAPFAGYIARLTRTGMLEVLGLDYIRTAYAKGLSHRRVVLRHALRGAIVPVVSFLGPATAGILTGSLVLERIFALPGMGSHFIEAATQRDYTLAMGMVLVYTFLLFVMNTLVDLSYALIDPRVKIK